MLHTDTPVVKMGVSGRPIYKRTARVLARLSDTENVCPTRRKSTNQQSNNGLRSPGGVLKTHSMSQSLTSLSMESLKETLSGKKVAGDSQVLKSSEAVKSVMKRGKAREVLEAEPGSPPVKKKPSASTRVDEEVTESSEEEETASKIKSLSKKTTYAASGSSPSKKKTPKGKSTEKVEEEEKEVEPTRKNRALKKVHDEGVKVPIARGTRSSSRKSSQEDPKKKGLDSEMVGELVSEDEKSEKFTNKKKQIAKKGALSLHSEKGEEFVSEMDENSDKIPKKRQSTKKPVLKGVDSNQPPSATHKEEEEELPAVTEKKQSDKAVKGAPKAGKSIGPKEATSPKKQMTKKCAKKIDSDLIEAIISEEDEKTKKVVDKKKSIKRAQKTSPKKSLSTDVKQSSRKPVLKVAPKAAPNFKFLSKKSQAEEMFSESSDEEADEEKEESVKKRKGAAAKDATKELDADSGSLREDKVKKAAPSRLTKKLNIDQVISQLDSELDQEEEQVAETSIPKHSNRSTVQQPPKPAETGVESTTSSTTSRSTRRSARSPVLKSSTKRIPAVQSKVSEGKVAEPTFPRRSNRPTVQQPSKTVETDLKSTSSSIPLSKPVAEPISRRSSRPTTIQQPLKTIPARSKPSKEVAKPPSRRPSRSSSVQQSSKSNESDEALSNVIEEVAEPTPSRRYSRPRVQQPAKTFVDEDEDGSTTSSATSGRVLKQKKLTDYTAKKSPTKRAFHSASFVVEEKRIPIWEKMEPKPEPVSSKADDTYELEFSDIDAKPAKEKRKRAPRKHKTVKVVEPEVRPEVPAGIKPLPVLKSKENIHRNKPELDRSVAPKEVEKKKAEADLRVRPKDKQNATTGFRNKHRRCFSADYATTYN